MKQSNYDVIVVGGGLVGLETAEFLLTQMRKVTLVEMRDDIGDDPFTKMMHIGPLTAGGVKILTKSAGDKAERRARQQPYLWLQKGQQAARYRRGAGADGARAI